MNESAIQALKHVFDYVERESHIAMKQAEEARAIEDYRAFDRHSSFSHAMKKVRARCLAYAREQFLSDLENEEKQIAGPSKEDVKKALVKLKKTLESQEFINAVNTAGIPSAEEDSK